MPKLNHLILTVLFFLSGSCTYKNVGHRLGGDYYTKLPENSLEVYRKSLDNLQDIKEKRERVKNSRMIWDFRYAEFDVRETKDEKHVVWHDWTISSLFKKKNSFHEHNLKMLEEILTQSKSDLRSEEFTTESDGGDLSPDDLLNLMKRVESTDGALKANDQSISINADDHAFDLMLKKIKQWRQDDKKSYKAATEKLENEIKEFESEKTKSSLRIADLTYDQIRSFKLDNGEKIPSVQEVLDESISSSGKGKKLKYPLVVELKSVRKIDPLIKLITEEKYSRIPIEFMSFPTLKLASWCKKLKKTDTNIMAPYLHFNYCFGDKDIFDPKRQLVNMKYSQIRIDEFGNEMNSFYDEKSKSKNKNFVLFVHGRGSHPFKASNADLFKKISRDKLNVLMFNWDSKSKSTFHYKEPKKQAKASADELLELFCEFQKYKDGYKYKAKSTLLVHSMGNIIIKSMMENEDYRKSKCLAKDLFDNLVMTAPDVDSKGHNKWLKRIGFSKNVYILSDFEDITLLGSKFANRGKTRLGQKFKGPLVKGNNEVGFHYIETPTETMLFHRYYTEKGCNRGYLCEFFEEALNGKSVDFKHRPYSDYIKETRFIKGTPVYRLKYEKSSEGPF